MKKLLLLALLGGTLATVTGGCTGTVQNGNDSTATRSDSIAQPLSMLPDTAMASAADVIYTIEVKDTVTSGTLSLTVESAYDTVPGVFTFRGGTRRDMRASGHVTGTPSRIVKDWEFQTYEDTTPTQLGVWGGGTGWTGQPLYVEWTQAQMDEFKRTSPALTPDFKSQEIIVGSLCSKLYFLDFATGKISRQPLDVGNPIKGTTSLDPAMNGSLYVGQGVPARRPFGHMAVDLSTHKVNYFWPEDSKAGRHWGAYDSSPIVVGEFLFWPGENGTLYKYTRQGNGQLTMHSCLRYTIKGDGAAAGMEASMCAYRNYGYVGDNHGDIVCVNLNTMKPVWHYDNVDDIDASLVLEVEDGVPYIYAGCEVDRQGPTGLCHLVKLNGLTGEPAWTREIECNRLSIGDKHFDGGLYCTPLLGHGDCEGMMFLNMCQPGNSSASQFMAIDRKTGSTIYTIPLKAWAWSSPVAFYNENDKLFVMAGDSQGYAYLIDGKKGTVLFTELLVANFESSPVVKDNYAVVGSRGNKIYRFAIK